MSGSRPSNDPCFQKLEPSRPRLLFSFKKAFNGRLQGGQPKLNSEESCMFCLKKVRASKLPLLIQKSLYARHSSSVNFYYTKDLNKLLREEKYREGHKLKEIQMIDENNEYLTCYYRLSDFPGMMANQWRYHQFNIDQPRFFEKSMAGVVEAHFCAKRKLQEKAIRRMLDQLSDSELENCDLDLKKFMQERIEIEEKPQAQIDILRSIIKWTKTEQKRQEGKKLKSEAEQYSEFEDGTEVFCRSISINSVSSIKPYLQIDEFVQTTPKKHHKMSSDIKFETYDSCFSMVDRLPSAQKVNSNRKELSKHQAKASALTSKSRGWGDIPIYPIESEEKYGEFLQIKSNQDIFNRIKEGFSKGNRSNKQGKSILTASKKVLTNKSPKIDQESARIKQNMIKKKSEIEILSNKRDEKGTTPSCKRMKFDTENEKKSSHKSNSIANIMKVKKKLGTPNLNERRDLKLIPNTSRKFDYSSQMSERKVEYFSDKNKKLPNSILPSCAPNLSSFQRETSKKTFGSLSGTSSKRANSTQKKLKTKKSNLLWRSELNFQNTDFGSIVDRALKGPDRKKKNSKNVNSTILIDPSKPVLHSNLGFQRLTGSILKKISGETAIWPNTMTVTSKHGKLVRNSLQIKPKFFSSLSNSKALRASSNDLRHLKIKELKAQFIQELEKGLVHHSKNSTRKESPRHRSPNSPAQSFDGISKCRSEAGNSRKGLLTCRSLKSEDSLLHCPQSSRQLDQIKRKTVKKTHAKKHHPKNSLNLCTQKPCFQGLVENLVAKKLANRIM